jgi:hypothetical protein
VRASGKWSRRKGLRDDPVKKGVLGLSKISLWTLTPGWKPRANVSIPVGDGEGWSLGFLGE